MHPFVSIYLRTVEDFVELFELLSVNPISEKGTP